MDLSSKAVLNNGVGMPYFGFGTFRLESGLECQRAVNWALEAGIRLVDTAMIYDNEVDVGLAVKKSGVPREEIFVTTKLWTTDFGFDKSIKACNASLKRLGLDYVDLYLIHWPEGVLRGESWKALEKLYRDGKCKAIGVSNYAIRHLEELLGFSDIIPAVNQVEFNPYLYQKELLDYCRKHKIQLEAYRSLLKGLKMEDERLVEIASKYYKTPAQILLRWALQHEVAVIPKSKSKERILENASLFDFNISQKDMKALDSFNENYRTGWNPNEIL
jgi:diketogulonate reductase-like aldo/keto reductase